MSEGRKSALKNSHGHHVILITDKLGLNYPDKYGGKLAFIWMEKTLQFHFLL